MLSDRTKALRPQTNACSRNTKALRYDIKGVGDDRDSGGDSGNGETLYNGKKPVPIFAEWLDDGHAALCAIQSAATAVATKIRAFS